MNTYESKDLRNVVFLGHSGEGKTSLAEAMLYNTKYIDRLGKVDEGTSVMDYDTEEIKRHISISLCLGCAEWKGGKINILDAPGFFDFEGEVVAAKQAADFALIVNGASGNMPVGTEKALERVTKDKLPAILFITAINKENSSYNDTINDITATYDRITPLELPILENNKMIGTVNVIDKVAYMNDGSTKEIPDDMKDSAEELLFKLTEIAAEADDELLEKYFEGEALTDEELLKGIKAAVLDCKVILALCGSSTMNLGVTNLMDAIIKYMPSPIETPSAIAIKDGEEIEVPCVSDAPLFIQVFKAVVDPFVGKLLMFKVMSGIAKTGEGVYNVNASKAEKLSSMYILQGKKQVSVNELKAGDIGALAKLSYTNAGDTLGEDKSCNSLFNPIPYPIPVITLHVTSENKDDEEKVISGLHKLKEEDSTFTLEKNLETRQMLISGLGETQLDVICKKLKNKYKVEAKLEDPRIPYRETIRKTVEQQGKYKKQSGGHGQYGDVHIRFSPNTGLGFEFTEEVVGGTVPKNYFPAVEKGLRECLPNGIQAGYTVVDVKATLYFGSYHAVDSSEMAFKMAASVAFKEGLAKASPILLEPIFKTEITVPESYMGDILGDLNKRRGRILGMDPVDGKQVISAQVPQAEMFKYATDLRSMTQGRGSFVMEFERYEEVPNLIAQKIIEDSKKED